MGRKKDTVVLCSPLSDDMRPSMEQGDVGFFFPPLGLLLVAQQLHDAGYTVKFFDGNCDKDYRSEMLSYIGEHKERILFIGFYLAFLQSKDLLQVARDIKALDQDLQIVVGGPLPSVFPTTIIQNPDIDACCAGDGCDAVLQIAKQLQDGGWYGGIKNVVYKQSGAVVSNELGHREALKDRSPIRHENFIDIEKYVHKFMIYLPKDMVSGINRAMPILTGTGCNFKCAFCENALIGNRHNFIPAEEIIEQIKYYHNTFNIDSFSMFDEDFFTNKRRVREFIDLLKKENLPIKWGAQCRASHITDDYLNADFLTELESAGCVRLALGAESGSDRMLKLVNKCITREDILNSARMAADAGIVFSYSLIVNLPDETTEDLLQTYSLIQEIAAIKKTAHISAVHQYFAYPGTPLSIAAEKRLGIRPMDTLTYKDFANLTLHDYNALVNVVESDPIRDFLVKNIYEAARASQARVGQLYR